MPKILPLFHTATTNLFCHLYLCLYKKRKNGPLCFGISSFPRDPNALPNLEDEDELSICWRHIADFDAAELLNFDAQTSPVKGCTVKSYMSNSYTALVVSEASKAGKVIGWWVSYLDSDDKPECCVALQAVGEEADEDWVEACEKADAKLNRR